jgi:hypothetical protein
MGEVIKLPERFEPFDRKFAILRVPYRDVANLLFPVPDFKIIREIDLPKDVKLLNVWADQMCQDFCFLLWSEEFEVVLPGADIRTIPCILKQIRVYVDEPEAKH